MLIGRMMSHAKEDTALDEIGEFAPTFEPRHSANPVEPAPHGIDNRLAQGTEVYVLDENALAHPAQVFEYCPTDCDDPNCPAYSVLPPQVDLSQRPGPDSYPEQTVFASYEGESYEGKPLLHFEGVVPTFIVLINRDFNRARREEGV